MLCAAVFLFLIGSNTITSVSKNRLFLECLCWIGSNNQVKHKLVHVKALQLLFFFIVEQIQFINEAMTVDELHSENPNRSRKSCSVITEETNSMCLSFANWDNSLLILFVKSRSSIH